MGRSFRSRSRRLPAPCLPLSLPGGVATWPRRLTRAARKNCSNVNGMPRWTSPIQFIPEARHDGTRQNRVRHANRRSRPRAKSGRLHQSRLSSLIRRACRDRGSRAGAEIRPSLQGGPQDFLQFTRIPERPHQPVPALGVSMKEHIGASLEVLSVDGVHSAVGAEMDIVTLCCTDGSSGCAANQRHPVREVPAQSNASIRLHVFTSRWSRRFHGWRNVFGTKAIAESAFNRNPTR